MTENNRDESFEAPRVLDRSPRPRGVLPRNVQTWVILGLSTLMIVVLALSGRKSPKDRPAESPIRGQAATDANLARIEEYRRRIEEESRRLATEQERLRRAQAELEGQHAASAPAATDPADTRPRYETVRRYEERGQARPEKTAADRDRERREYESLFASSIALTH